MRKKTVQAKHIDDCRFIALVEKLQRELATHPDWNWRVFTYSTGAYNGHPWVMIWDVQNQLPEFPPKVIQAKFAALHKRGLIDGCPCGCRGDLQVTKAGAAFLKGTS